MSRAYNFCAGPAALPEAVLQRAREEMLDYRGTGMSVMEKSHRDDVIVARACLLYPSAASNEKRGVESVGRRKKKKKINNIETEILVKPTHKSSEKN